MLLWEEHCADYAEVQTPSSAKTTAGTVLAASGHADVVSAESIILTGSSWHPPLVAPRCVSRIGEHLYFSWYLT